MRKKIFLMITLTLVIFLTSCKETISDGQRFSKEYTQVSEYNVFVYKNADEIIKILQHGTGVVYLGFPECQWCQAYVPKLNEVADIEGLEKINYYNILNDRKENTEAYQTMVEILADYLKNYDEDGNKRIFVPTVVVVQDGEIIGFDDESSYDTLGFDNPNDYWTDERVQNLKLRLSSMISPIVDNKCSDCNK